MSQTAKCAKCGIRGEIVIGAANICLSCWQDFKYVRRQYGASTTDRYRVWLRISKMDHILAEKFIVDWIENG